MNKSNELIEYFNQLTNLLEKQRELMDEDRYSESLLGSRLIDNVISKIYDMRKDPDSLVSEEKSHIDNMAKTLVEFNKQTEKVLVEKIISVKKELEEIGKKKRLNSAYLAQSSPPTFLDKKIT